MAFPLLPVAGGALALFLLTRKSSAYSQAPFDGSSPPTKEPAPPSKSWKDMPPALQEQVAAALGALGVSPATGELSGAPVSPDAIKLATQTAALCESQGFYDVAKELRRLIAQAVVTVPTPAVAETIKTAAPPGLSPAQVEALARTLTLDRDPAAIRAVLTMLEKLPPSPERDNLIAMSQALLLQLAAAQSTTQTMQQIDQVIKSPGLPQLAQAVSPLPPVAIPVLSTPTVSIPNPSSSSTLPAQLGAVTHAALRPLTGTRVLQSGSRGDDVKAWQTLLRLDGFSTVTIDGAFGPVTVASTKTWQKQRGLTPDGKVGPGTRAKIGALPAPDKAVPPTPVSTLPAAVTAAVSHVALRPLTGTRTLQAGSTGDDVKAWQSALRLDGFAAVAIDGVFGPGTVAATKSWQAQRGLSPDGKVGAGTRAKMGSPPSKSVATAPSPASPKPSASSGSSKLDSIADPAPKARTLSRGMKGADVQSWQRVLKGLGYNVEVDGNYGPNVESQTRSFQQLMAATYADPRLVTDGKVGPMTRRAAALTIAARSAQAA